MHLLLFFALCLFFSSDSLPFTILCILSSSKRQKQKSYLEGGRMKNHNNKSGVWFFFKHPKSISRLKILADDSHGRMADMADMTDMADMADMADDKHNIATLILSFFFHSIFLLFPLFLQVGLL